MQSTGLVTYWHVWERAGTAGNNGLCDCDDGEKMMINTRWAVEAALERLGVTSETTRVYEMYRLENTGSVVATRKAKEKGLTVVFPEENELFIDIDDDSSMRMYVKNSPLIWRHLGVEKETIRA